MRKTLTLTLVALTAVFFTACAKQPVEKTNLTEEKILKQSSNDESVYYYLKDGTDFKQYSKVIVPKIETLKASTSTDNKEESQKLAILDNELKEKLSTYFSQSIDKTMNSVAINNPGNRTLKMDVSIDKVNIVYEDLKFYNYIPVALVAKSISRGTGIEDKDALVVITMKFTDVESQEVVAQVIDSKKIENINEIKDITFKKAKPLLDKWVARFQLRMEEFSKGNYKNL